MKEYLVLIINAKNRTEILHEVIVEAFSPNFAIIEASRSFEVKKHYTPSLRKKRIKYEVCET